MVGFVLAADDADAEVSVPGDIGWVWDVRDVDVLEARDDVSRGRDARGGSARRSREMSRVFLSARNSSGVSSSTTAHPSNSACWYRARHRPISTPSNSSSALASSPVRYATPGGRNTRFPLRAVEPG